MNGEVWQDERAGFFCRPTGATLGYVFQEASLFAHLSVRRNLEYGLQTRRGAAQRPVEHAES